MTIELKRYRYRPDTIDGYIYIDDKKVCDCAENAQHCLLVGKYQISSGWAVFARGNGAYNRKDERILVGEYLIPGCLIRSKEAFNALCERIRKSLSRGNEVTLCITRDQNLLFQKNV